MQRIFAWLLTAGLLFSGCAVSHGSAPVTEAALPSTTVTVSATEAAPDPPASPAVTVSTESSSETEALLIAAQADIHAISARYGFVYDLTAGALLYTHGEQTAALTPASLTKLLTIRIALEVLDPNAVVTAGEEVTWIDPLSSTSHVSQGTRLTVTQLIQGMMMQSGNDAAYVLAVAAGRTLAGPEEVDSARESLQVFMDYLNRRAPELGLYHTHFVTPDGTTAEGHCTTPEDLLIIARLALEIPMIREFAATQQAQVTFADGTTHQWQNTNWMLNPESDHYCPAAIGLKTGSTRAAGNCFLALFEDGDRELLICVLGCPTISHRFLDARYLYDAYRLH